jgi:uncharacterized protein YjgD (DUF1641 family)
LAEATGSVGNVTITLGAEDAEQFKAFLAKLPRINALVDRLDAVSSDGRLDSLATVLAATKSMLDALNDDAIQSLATTAGKTVELVTLLSQDGGRGALSSLRDHGPQVYALIDRLAQLERDGVFHSLGQAAYALKATMDALNDDSITNLASTVTDASALWRDMSPLLSSPELRSALNRLIKMEREGVLAAMEDVGYAVKSLRDSLNDEAMTNLASVVAGALNIWKLISPYVAAISRSPVPLMLKAMTGEGVTEQLAAAKPRGGMSMLSPSDPDIRKGFGVLLELLKVIGSEFTKLEATQK